MARMYPVRAGALIKIQSPAERKLYELLRDGLPSDYVVFHSVAWLARRSAQRRGRTARPTSLWRTQSVACLC